MDLYSEVSLGSEATHKALFNLLVVLFPQRI